MQSSTRNRLPLLAILAVGACARLYRFNFESVWLDEAMSFRAARQPLIHLRRLRRIHVVCLPAALRHMVKCISAHRNRLRPVRLTLEMREKLARQNAGHVRIKIHLSR